MSIPARRLLRPELVLAALSWLLFAPAPAPAQSTEGLFVTVPNPITSDAVERIQKQINTRVHAELRRPQTIVFDFNPDDKPASTARPGVCSDLTAFIRELKNKHGVLTVAFVHNKVSGHAVMPVLACQELVMSKGASIGEIAGEGIEPERGEYRGYFGGEPRFPVIQKMYDREVRLVRGRNRTTQKPQYADQRDKEAMNNLVAVEEVPGVQDNALGLYTTPIARSLELARGTAETTAEVAERYGLPPSALRDPLLGRTPDVYRWDLTGDVDGKMRDTVNRVIRDVRKKGGNVLVLVIKCGGHDLVTARALADDLVQAQAGDDSLQIIGFVPDNAPAAGTVIAFGCTEIVMSKSRADAAEPSEAVIGDFEEYLKRTRPGEIDANLAAVRDLAKKQGYPEVLVDGMFKRDVEIVRANRVTSANRKVLLTREQFNRDNEEAKAAAQPGQNPDVWVQDKVVKPPGQLLSYTDPATGRPKPGLNATLAAELGVARFTVEGTDVKDVVALYGYKDAKDPDPGWLERFADFLRLPVVTVLLVVIGFTGLILELKVPGLTVPGIIAALCFILVFWAHSGFSGQTFMLALLLFLMGLVLVGLEIFVLPGFGACGIFGILCMLAGLGLVTLDKIPETGTEWGTLGVKVSQYLFAMMGAVALAFTIAKFLPRVPYANRMILKAPSERSETAVELLPGAGEAAELLGAIGTTSTPLRPAGVVKFGDKFVDVVSDGGFIPAGTRVQVIQVEATRIVVKEV
jgi:membrane-bound serine protease (ClpP class)